MLESSAQGWHPVGELTALVDGELSAAEAEALRAHLAGCPPCAAEHAKAKAASRALHGLGKARAPLGFGARVLKRVRRERHSLLRHDGLDQKVPFEGAIILFLVAAAAAVLVGYEIHARGGLFASNAPRPAVHQKLSPKR